MSIFTILNQPVAVLVTAFSKLMKVTYTLHYCHKTGTRPPSCQLKNNYNFPHVKLMIRPILVRTFHKHKIWWLMPTWHSKANYAGCLSVKLICSKNCIVCQQKCSSWEDAKSPLLISPTYISSDLCWQYRSDILVSDATPNWDWISADFWIVQL